MVAAVGVGVVVVGVVGLGLDTSALFLLCLLKI